MLFSAKEMHSIMQPGILYECKHISFIMGPEKSMSWIANIVKKVEY